MRADASTGSRGAARAAACAVVVCSVCAIHVRHAALRVGRAARWRQSRARRSSASAAPAAHGAAACARHQGLLDHSLGIHAHAVGEGASACSSTRSPTSVPHPAMTAARFVLLGQLLGRAAGDARRRGHRPEAGVQAAPRAAGSVCVRHRLLPHVGLCVSVRKGDGGRAAPRGQEGAARGDGEAARSLDREVGNVVPRVPDPARTRSRGTRPAGWATSATTSTRTRRGTRPRRTRRRSCTSGRRPTCRATSSRPSPPSSSSARSSTRSPSWPSPPRWRARRPRS